MASLSYKLAYLEAIRVWLKYKNYKGDKRKRIYLLLQERADSARDFLWNIKEFPNFLKISKLYEDEDITTYEDMVKRIFDKLEGTTEHDNAYYRARIAAIQKLQDSNPSIKKFLQNGFVPADKKSSFEKFIEDYIVDHVDNSPLTFTEQMTYNTWYEQHPEKVAGTMVEGSSLYFPVLVKGTKIDVENVFKAALKEQEQNKKPTPKYKIGDRLDTANGLYSLMIHDAKYDDKEKCWKYLASIKNNNESVFFDGRRLWLTEKHIEVKLAMVSGRNHKPTQEQKPKDDELKLLQKFFRGSGKKVRINDYPPAIGESPIHEYGYATGTSCSDVRYEVWSEGNGWDYLRVCFVFDDGTVKVECDALPEYKEFIASKKEGKPTPKYKVGDKFTDKGGSVFTITEIRSYNELNDCEKGVAKRNKAQFFYYLNDGHQTVACWDAHIEDLFDPIKDDNDDELELLELEAEALALELEMGKKTTTPTKTFRELVEENGDKILHWREATNPNKEYVTPFNYSVSHGGSIDSFKYYNDYVVEISKK